MPLGARLFIILAHSSGALGVTWVAGANFGDTCDQTCGVLGCSDSNFPSDAPGCTVMQSLAASGTLRSFHGYPVVLADCIDFDANVLPIIYEESNYGVIQGVANFPGICSASLNNFGCSGSCIRLCPCSDPAIVMSTWTSSSRTRGTHASCGCFDAAAAAGGTINNSTGTMTLTLPANACSTTPGTSGFSSPITLTWTRRMLEGRRRFHGTFSAGGTTFEIRGKHAPRASAPTWTVKIGSPGKLDAGPANFCAYTFTTQDGTPAPSTTP